MASAKYVPDVVELTRDMTDPMRTVWCMFDGLLRSDDVFDCNESWQRMQDGSYGLEVFVTGAGKASNPGPRMWIKIDRERWRIVVAFTVLDWRTLADEEMDLEDLASVRTALLLASLAWR